MVDLKTIRNSLIQELVHQDLRRVFYILKQNLDSQSYKYDDLNLLNGRYVAASRDQHIKGTLADEEARVIFNRIKSSLLDLINSLQAEDLKVKIAPSPTNGFEGVYENRKVSPPNTKGKILYRVPALMQMKVRQKCIVRVAFDEEDLEYLNKKDESTKVEPIRISEVMEVQFVDQSHCDAFKITSISTQEQFVDRDDFTEWIFYVEPLLEGIYDLMMKVSVVIKKHNREIRKDIILEKKIEVITEVVDDKMIIGNASKNYGAVAAAGSPLITSDGFEVFEQSIILDGIPIPPLDPCIPDTPLPPPPPSPQPVTWLSNLLSVIGVVMIGVIIYFWWQDPESEFTSKGGGIIEATEIVEANNIAGIDTSQVQPTSSDTPPSYLSLNCEPNESEKLLNLQVLGGKLPFEVNIKKAESEDAVWKFVIFQNKDTVVSYKYIDFLTKGDFEATVSDFNNESNTDRFSLMGKTEPPIEEPVEESIAKDALTINCIPDQKTKTLSIDINGNRPPFKIFINGKQDARLSKLKKYKKTYADAKFKDGQKVKIKVVDRNGNQVTKFVTIKNPPIEIKPVPPVVLAECFDFKQFDDCWVLYLYRKETRSNWLMNEKIFADFQIVENMKAGDFMFFKMDIATLTESCIKANIAFTDLEDATTFVYQGRGNAPKKLKGLVTVENLKKEIDCLNGRGVPNDDRPNNYDKNAKTKKHQIDLKTNTTYLYSGVKSKGGVSIRKASSPKFRVQLASFGEEENFSKFIDELEQFNLPICMRLEKGLYRVYLGGFEREGEAKVLLKKLSSNPVLERELGKIRMKEFMIKEI